MTNREVAKAFAKGATTGKSLHMFIDGNCVYSYGRHFIIAKKVQGQAYVNAGRYSITTSKHQSLVRYELTSQGWIVQEATSEALNLIGQ